MSFSPNPNGPRGLSPVKAASGTPTRSNTYQIAGNGADVIYSGQPVKLDSNGQIVVLAAAGDSVVGVFDGCEYVDSAGDIKFSPYWPAPGSVAVGTTVKARVYDNPDEQFLIKADADLSQNDIGAYFDFTVVAGTGGDATTGKSSLELDVASKNASPAGKQVVLRSISVREGGSQLAVVQFVDPAFAAQIG